jgi:hypothetical protein
MTLWLLNHLSVLELTLLIVGGITALAVIGCLAARKAFPDLAEGEFEPAASTVPTAMQLFFVFTLALSIASLSGRFAAASSTVASEANLITQLLDASHAFPLRDQFPFFEGIGRYVHAVADDEWGTMRNGKESLQAAEALDALYALYQGYRPEPGAAASFYAASLPKLDQISASRRARLEASKEGLPTFLRIFLVLGLPLFIALSYPVKIQSLRTQMLVMGAVAALFSFGFLLTMLLDYPFAGEVSVDNDLYKKGSLAVFWYDEEPLSVSPEETEELSARRLAGVWRAEAFGVTVFRQVGGEIHGVGRGGRNTVVGTISDDGVFRGWWCEEPTRKPPTEAGEVEWRLIRIADGELVAGRWRRGTDGPWRGGWDLRRVGGPEPVDLIPRFDNASEFCRHP